MSAGPQQGQTVNQLTLQKRGCRGYSFRDAIFAVYGLQELWDTVVLIRDDHSDLFDGEDGGGGEGKGGGGDGRGREVGRKWGTGSKGINVSNCLGPEREGR